MAIKDLFRKGCLLKRVQHYAHCFSSKVLWSQSVERFQAAPQSLYNTVYKLISKILATIGLSRSSRSWPNQEAIVKSRHIGEGVIIAHENDPFYGPHIIQESGCLKLDMMKALLSPSRKTEGMALPLTFCWDWDRGLGFLPLLPRGRGSKLCLILIPPG